MKRYAIVVGIGEYDDPGIVPVRFARQDAESFAMALEGLGFSNVRLLLSGGRGIDSATLPNVENGLNYIVEKSEEGDLVLFYFCGHGIWHGNDTHLLTQKCDADIRFLARNSIPLSLIKGHMNRLNAKERMLILDCCRNEPFSAKGEGENRLIEEMKVSARDILPRGLSKTLSGGGIIYACEEGHRAFEIEDNSGGNGILTKAILEVIGEEEIEEGCAVVKKRITFEDVSKHVKTRVGELAGLIGQTQFPYIDHAGTALLVLGEKREPAVTKPVIEQTGVSIISQPQVKPVSILQKSSLPEEFTNSIGMEFVLIKAGSFMMGSPSNETGRSANEARHRVILTKDFYLQITEVTQGQYEEIMGENLSHWKGGDLPVERVSWNDALEFCEKLSQKEGKEYRLPTEAEWEYACRAGTTTRYYFGDDERELEEYAWYEDNSDERTHEVGQKKPNLWGLYDMMGNVWEWCQDWYGEYPVKDVIDPKGPNSGEDRVLRGGSFCFSASAIRSAVRLRNHPDIRLTDDGFRCARTP